MSIFKQVELSLCHADLPGNVSWSIWEPRGAVFRWLGFPGVWGWAREAEKTLGRTEALLQFPGHCPPGAGHQKKETDIIVLTATQVLLCHLSKCLLLQTILFSKRALHQQSSPAHCSGRRLVVFSYFQSYGNLSIQRISQGTLKHVTK